MLVLSRKKSERIFLEIPDRKNPIIIQVVGVVRDGKVQLGIEADSDVNIAREELFNASARTV